MNKDEQEVRRLLEVLRTLMRMLGVSNREVERRLGLHPSSLTRLFNGQVEAKLELVLGIARAVGLEYNELFDFAYPERPDPDSLSASAQRIRSLLMGLQSAKPRRSAAAPEPSPVSSETGELREMIQELLNSVKVGKGGK